MNPFLDLKNSVFKNSVRAQVPLAMHTWLQLGGEVDYFAEPQTLDELKLILTRSHEAKLPVRVLGYGSNILVPDEGVRGVVIRLTAAPFTQIDIEKNIMTIGAGAKLGRVVTAAVHAGLAGIEWLIGIPGTVGGALCGNVGNHSCDLGQWVESIDVVDFSGTLSTLTRSELAFGYRASSLENLVIVSAKLALDEDDPVMLGKRMQKLWIVRRTTQPMSQQGAGQLFKDARGISASDLITEIGLKGLRIGGVSLAERDANFIIVEPEATASDVRKIIEKIQNEVFAQREIELELQMELW